MTKKYGRTYWKDCVRPEMCEGFIKNIVIKNVGEDLANGVEEFVLKRSDGLEIYVPEKDITEYIKRNMQ